MDDFPDFLKNDKNEMKMESKVTAGVEGYVFDGADGSQILLCKCADDSPTSEHVHEFDEYCVVLQGQYTYIIGEDKISIGPGDEHVIPGGLSHSGEAVSGTRWILAFGGKRAERISE